MNDEVNGIKDLDRQAATLAWLLAGGYPGIAESLIKKLLDDPEWEEQIEDARLYLINNETRVLLR